MATTTLVGAALGQCKGIVMGAAQMLTQGFHNCTILQVKESSFTYTFKYSRTYDASPQQLVRASSWIKQQIGTASYCRRSLSTL